MGNCGGRAPATRLEEHAQAARGGPDHRRPVVCVAIREQGSWDAGAGRSVSTVACRSGRLREGSGLARFHRQHRAWARMYRAVFPLAYVCTDLMKVFSCDVNDREAVVAALSRAANWRL